MAIRIVERAEPGRAGEVQAAARWGEIQYRSHNMDNGVWKAPGFVLRLVDAGGRMLARLDVECKRGEWDDIARAQLDAVEPWIPVLRALRGSGDTRGADGWSAEIERVRRAARELVEVDQGWASLDELLEAYQRDILRWATAEQIEAAAGGPAGVDHQRLAAAVERRLDWARGRVLLPALGAAPWPVAQHPIPRGWFFPDPGGSAPLDERDREYVAPYVGRMLLEAWRMATAQGDALVMFAHEAGVTKAAIHRASGIARTTINQRLGAAAAGDDEAPDGDDEAPGAGDTPGGEGPDGA